MKITVNDCIKLPILSKANIVAGRGGLNRVVKGVSVLETSKTIIDNNSYSSLGEELVITGLTTCYEDIEGILRCIRLFAKGNDAGLVIFYVGIYLKKIPQEIIDLADELDFPIIVMPENRDDIPYSYVIYEVMECILRNKLINNAWSKSQYQIEEEFVQAILSEDKMTLHRLSFYINDKAEDLKYMIYLYIRDEKLKDINKKQEILDYIRSYYYQKNIKAYVGIYEHSIAIFIPKNINIEEEDTYDLFRYIQKKYKGISMSYLDGLDSLDSIISAYKLCRFTIKSVPFIFQTKNYYLRHHLLFTEQCINLIKESESDIQYYLSILNKVENYDVNLYKTLEVYTIDCDMNILKTSESLFLHKNSVQYRLNKIKELIGSDKFEFPAINQLIIAMSIKRIRMKGNLE